MTTYVKKFLRYFGAMSNKAPIYRHLKNNALEDKPSRKVKWDSTEYNTPSLKNDKNFIKAFVKTRITQFMTLDQVHDAFPQFISRFGIACTYNLSVDQWLDDQFLQTGRVFSYMRFTNIGYNNVRRYVEFSIIISDKNKGSPSTVQITYGERHPHNKKKDWSHKEDMSVTDKMLMGLPDIWNE